MPWELLVGVVALVVGLSALVVALVVLRRSRRPTPSPSRGDADADARPQRPQLAVVVNPSKASTRRAIETVRRLAGEAALPAPRFYETTVEDPGTGQAREAVRDGADVVVAAGGDGTVRAVAEGMLGTEVPMGILPAGTGNLLARNLDLPLTDTQEALAVILGGVDRSIDVGRIRVTERPPDEEDDDDTAHLFLVIAGLGFDAAMVADADDQLKDRMGWVAYFLAGARHLHGRRMATRIAVDDEEPVETRLRSIMVGNCGRLPGGINLLPDASLDDGVLDVAAIDTRAGLAGWAQLFGEVVAQGMGVQNDLPAKIGRIDHVKARRATIRVEDGEQAQADGEVLGRAIQIETWVEPGTLVVRAPA
ncbi:MULTISPECIES: diacylglycerol kinase family protein [unclassified Isoptericola]|uniref:diacylglycerol/lipid kinase family protein n=1 Tax=unclassified Isoptericola TaxID=2623355 RepID=UPI0027125B39|nr:MULTISPECIES: diacylglycerol kinase family protein [unclassified Isoptericola]MDO8145736.1 diacylglycerol kinase family protein [Isoptericola sp. 178]MDO8147923.1 diacylglycerol kinase family protein [Isoptericola sp. b515]MDO8149816.1 diacylglycerol kinase family protein [Isoptericola sp. b408]